MHVANFIVRTIIYLLFSYAKLSMAIYIKKNPKGYKDDIEYLKDLFYSHIGMFLEEIF